MTPFQILLGFATCSITSLALGITAVRILGLDLSRLECASLGYVLGSAVNSTFVLAIASMWIAREETFLVVAGLSAILLGFQYRWIRRLPALDSHSIPFFYKSLFALALVAYGLLYFRFAMSPEASPDGMSYHLGEVNLWVHAGGLQKLEDMYAALPQGIEMLYLFAFSIGRHSAAALVHFLFLMLLPVLMILYGIRFGFPHGAAAAAALIVFATPLIGWDGSVAYNDVALAVTCFASVYMLQIWRSEHRLPALIASSLMASYAFAIKYTGCFLLLFVALTVLWELRHEPKARILRTAAIAVGVMIILPLPYFLRNWIWYQNPIAFFGNSIFRNPYFHVWFEQAYIRGQVHLNNIEWRDVPLNLTLGGSKLSESLGPVYVLTPVALAGLLWPQTRFLVIAAMIVGCDYPANKSARFLIPVAPFVFLAIAFAASRFRLSRFCLALVTIAQLAICWPPITARLHTPKGASISGASWKTAFRLESEDTYLRRRADEYVMAKLIERYVPQGQSVFALGGGVAQSYTNHVLIDSYRSATAYLDSDLFYGNMSAAEYERRTWTASFPEVWIQRLRLRQMAYNPVNQWTVDEIRLFDRDVQVRPATGWHPSAFPNPWEIGFAFDGSDATRWQSQEPMSPGTHIDLRFDRALALDRVDVSSLEGQWDSKMDLSLTTLDGKTLSFGGAWHMNPMVDSRKAATRELKRQGIRFVVIGPDVFRPENIVNDPSAWGMHEVASAHTSRLYVID